MPELLPLALLDTALRAAALALLSVLGLQALRGRVRQPLGRVTAALAAGLALQLLAAAPAFAAAAPAAVAVALAAVSVGNAVVFWLFARALADARFEPRRADAATWAAVTGLSVLHCALVLRGAATLAAPTALALRLLPLGFAALALKALLARHAPADDGTRGLRRLLVGGGLAYVLGQQLLRLGQHGERLAGTGATADAGMLLALLALVAWRALQLDATGPWAPRDNGAEIAAGAAVMAFVPLTETIEPAAITPPERRAAPPRAERITIADPSAVTDEADDRLLAALERLMATQHAYRDEGLGIAALAVRLGAPEYRLRRLINGRLGHRNFNAYLNGLRLTEARAALADPAQRGLPVLSIALGAGFQSIGPFNRAFKAATGLTPTEFRRQKLADS